MLILDKHIKPIYPHLLKCLYDSIIYNLYDIINNLNNLYRAIL